MIWLLIVMVIILTLVYGLIEKYYRARSINTLYKLRDRLDDAFSSDTAHPSTTSQDPPSTGHCAAVALIVYCLFGGKIVKTFYRNQSHWFNEVEIFGSNYRVDLTGDQFGFVPVRICKVGRSRLFTGPLEVKTIESGVNEELKARASLLAARGGLEDVRQQIEDF